ncbi:MAG: hypothetical protein K2R93_19955 [Gemmatimonadaceae bacterium]|nr:hypothetical protein [Gemmatimonadaceae bacterium]
MGVEDLWDWVSARSSFAPNPEPGVWAAFVAQPTTADLARRLLPVWVGLLGTPRLDANDVEHVLADTGMLEFADDLKAEWDEALVVGASEVPWAALTLWPSGGSWLRLAEELVLWLEARRQ